MLCLTDNGDGTLSAANPQPTEYTSCTYVMVQPTELQPQIFNLTAAEGAQLSGAIVAVWAIAFAFRAAIYSLKTKERESENG